MEIGIKNMANEKLFDLIVVGEINPDLILSGNVDPSFGQVEKVIDDAVLTIGSSSCIFACGAARLGLKVAFIGKIGQDEFGNFMVGQLTSYGIDTSGIIVDSKIKTGLSVILSRGNDRAILTYAGSITELMYQEINLAMIGKARHLHIGSYFLLEKLQPDIPGLFKLAHSNGLTTSMDTNFDPDEKWDSGIEAALEETDIFLPNQTELEAISGVLDHYQAMAKIAGENKIVAVKLGAQGGIAYYSGETVQAGAIPVQVVDTTGAGDSFDAGYIYGYLSNWGVRKSLQFACICGSLSTLKPGGTIGQPTFAEAISFMPESIL